MNNSDGSTEVARSGDSWTLVDVTVERGAAELLADVLWGIGVIAIEELTHDDPDLVVLRTSFGEDPTEWLTIITQRHPGVGLSLVEVDRSVADTWREFAGATWVTDNVAIVPSWVEPPPHGEHVLIEPLDTFGLGNHPTTVGALRLCLEHVGGGEVVFDLGTGSGVLAVAIAKFRGARVLVHDIAPGSPRAVSINASLNNVADVVWSDGYPDEQVDLVVANILAPVLIEEADRIRACVGNGIIVLSGMRTDQVDKVVTAYGDVEVIDICEIDGWVSIALRIER